MCKADYGCIADALLTWDKFIDGMNLWDMVSQKKLDNRFDGYRLPLIPHFPKSTKRKRSPRKKRDDDQLCPFDLLVEVAGKLSSKSENSTLSPCCINGTYKEVVKQDLLCTEEAQKSETPDLLSNTVLVPEIDIKKQVACASKELPQASVPNYSEPPCLSVKSKIHDTAAGGLVVSNGGIGCSAYTDTCRSGSIRKSSAIAEVEEEKAELTRVVKYEDQMTQNRSELNSMDMYCLEDPIGLDVKPPAPASSDSSAEVPVCRDCPCICSMPKHESGMEHIVHRDDDDSVSGCTLPNSTTNKVSWPTNCTGDHGKWRLSTSKYWKATTNMSKYGQISHHDTQRKSFLHGKQMCYTRQRTHRSYFKRRFFEHRSVSTSNGGIFRMEVSNMHEKNSNNVKVYNPHGTDIQDGATSTKVEQSSYKSVKFSIKSFKIPELYIEIPETATVGSLKRAVMEAVTAILQGGLRVGVILQGKKARDDNKTLCQFGISNGDTLNSLGFTLEPTETQTSPPLTCSKNSHFLCLNDAVEPLARIPSISLSTDQDRSDASLQPVVTSCPESDHDSVRSRTDALSLDKTTENKLALVALPATSNGALAVVPLCKPKRLEHAQRRIRRPFSVAEVEALVEAVEKFGTGRWRDVKLRAFDSAKHRTYVDLKDKWKTLVHTAKISPQQRRGEPVPQELLDRVLAAQVSWSQQHAKLRIKEEPILPLPPPVVCSDPKQQLTSSSLLEPVET
ncbi:telomere repeat-binding protein 2-like isoform X2 [Curcuma longa]|uniref:telomere repeat-binding protein 2-like isoform X2 n=1 Tax=Curcuma longa TaxID=136217 RepID=UPI003D9F0A12